MTRPGASGIGGSADREDLYRHHKTTVATITQTTPTTAPATTGTTTVPISFSGVEELETESDRTREGGLGHKCDGILWAEHEARVTEENNESISPRFCKNAVSIAARTACSTFEDAMRADFDTSTETSTLNGERDWSRRPERVTKEASWRELPHEPSSCETRTG
jgi:hypothetical protein